MTNKVEIYVKVGEEQISQSVYIDTFKTTSYEELMVINSTNYKPVTESFSSFPPGFTGGTVNAVTLDTTDGNLIYAGQFTQYNLTSSYKGIVKLSPTGSVVVDYANVSHATSASRPIAVEVLSNGKVVAAGNFPSASGFANGNGVAQYNANGTFNTSFAPVISASAQMTCLAIDNDGYILAGGLIGINKRNMVKLNPTTGANVPGFNLGTGFQNIGILSDAVHAIAVTPDNDYVVGGDFIIYSGSTSRGLVKMNKSGSIVTQFAVGFGFGSDSCTSLAVDTDGFVYAAGDFTSYQGVAGINYLVKLDTSGSAVSTFNPQFTTGTSIENIVYKPDTHTLLILGGIVGYGYEDNLFSFLEIDADTGNLVEGFADKVQGFDSYTLDAQVSGSNTYIVGNFTQYGYFGEIEEQLVTVPIYDRLDMFDDENISLKLKIKDSSDISKVFSPFSQTFTVPNSNKNNRILNYFFDPSVVRSSERFVDAKIYINKELFKVGKISIDEGKFLYGNNSNYSLRFFTSLVGLKETLGEAKLSDLDFEEVIFQWNAQNVYDTITTNATNLDVYVPLISINDVWTFDTGSNNIVYTSPSQTKYIEYTELRPAIKYSVVMNKIIDTFGLDIECPLFDRPEYENVYIWMNNKSKISNNSVDIEITNNFTGSGPNPYFTASTSASQDIIQFVDNAFNYSSSPNYILTTTIFSLEDPTTGNPFPEDEVFTLYIDDADTGNNISEIAFSTEGNSTVSVGYHILRSQTPVVRRYKLRLSGNVDFTFSGVSFVFSLKFSPSEWYQRGTGFDPAPASVTSLDIGNNLGDMKIIDFLSSFFKTFNVRVIEDRETFKLNWETPQDFIGQTLDYTPYVDFKQSIVKTNNIFKTLNFKHSDSKYFRNVRYKELVNKEYGQNIYNSTSKYPLGEYVVETRYGVLNYFVLNNSNIFTSYGFTTDKPDNDGLYKPVAESNQLVLFYKNNALNIQNKDGDDSAVGFKLSNVVSMSSYVLFTNQDLGTRNSLTWDIDISPVDGTSFGNSLYNIYYSDEIERIYNTNTRIFEYDLVLPSNAIKDFDLRNHIVIGDKRFTIEEADINLINGKTKLKLMNIAPVQIDINDLPSNPTIFFGELI